MSGLVRVAVLIFLVSSLFSFRLKAQLSLPLSTLRLNSNFGSRIHPITRLKQFHSGVDLSARYEPVYAILGGVVSDTGEDELIGKYVKIAHGKLHSIYGHLSAVLIAKADRVQAGQIIARSGNSGRSSGPHLHFSIKISGKFFNPLVVLKALLVLNKNNDMEENATFENDSLPLAVILSLLAEKGSISLSPEQAKAYGADQADTLPVEEEGGEDGY